MNEMEKRQARRMIRNAKEIERHVFDLIDGLQQGVHGNEYDWADALCNLLAIKELTAKVHDVCFNCLDEIGGE